MLQNLNDAIETLKEFLARKDTFCTPSEGKMQSAIEAVLPSLLRVVDQPLSVTLMHCGHQKIQVIKTIRQWTNLGLKEAKDLSDRVPVDIPFSNRDVAERFIKDAEECGAKVAWKGVMPSKEKLDQCGIAIEFLHEVRAIREILNELNANLRASLGPWKIIDSSGPPKVNL